MHVLITNDDGPPSQTSSPYVHSFIATLQAAGATVSVVLPHTQRSWIGKAHLVGQTLTPSYFRPGALHTDDGAAAAAPRNDGGEEWILVDGTPASCTQIGLFHYFREKGPVDLVVSGPNYGRNSTALFALSSGTIGGAMEAAVCGRRAVALSYAFHDRNHDPDVIAGASRMAVKVVQHLYQNWQEGVDLYSVNVPLVEGVDGDATRVLYTNMLPNTWSGSSFEEIEAEGALSPEETEAEIRERGEVEGEGAGRGKAQYTHKLFKWAPKFTDVHRSVKESAPGNDGWAVSEGHVSVTPMKANFMHFDNLIGQEIRFSRSATRSSTEEQIASALNSTTLSAPDRAAAHSAVPRIEAALDTKEALNLYSTVAYSDSYVRPKIVAALQRHLPPIVITSAPPPSSAVPHKHLQWSDYEALDFDALLAAPATTLANAYVIRKALIRKHHLALTVRHWASKHPDSALARAFPTTCDFELDYAEFLDEALAEAWELTAALHANEGRAAAEREWWILKPGMSDRGQGIRLFSTEAELRAIFEEWEPESDDEDEDEDEEDEGEDEEGGEGGDGAGRQERPGDGIMTSHLRHFVAQRYIDPPLLVGGRKFHVRAYVLAVGGLRVYVYRPMLALFAAAAYAAPSPASAGALGGHLTNTCLQTGDRAGAVRAFWALAGELGQAQLDGVWRRVCAVVAEAFEAAARGQRVHFQALPNAFELFGVDFMVDADWRVWLLEVNAFPDFRQTGDELGGIIDGLMSETVRVAVVPFFEGKSAEDGADGADGAEGQAEGGDAEGDMRKVLDIELGGW